MECLASFGPGLRGALPFCRSSSGLFPLGDIAFSWSVAFLFVVSIDEVSIVLSTLPLNDKFVRLPRLLSAFRAYCYHIRANCR
jgi:hypothetical protein